MSLYIGKNVLTALHLFITSELHPDQPQTKEPSEWSSVLLLYQAFHELAE